MGSNGSNDLQCILQGGCRGFSYDLSGNDGIYLVSAGVSGTICIMDVIFMLIGGTALFTGLFLIYASLSFFTFEGLEFMNVFTDGAREYGKYPIGVYGKRMLRLCTFIVPYALVQYYPLIYLIGRKESTGWVFVPMLAVLFLIPCYALRKFGVRKYQSSGS